MKSENVEAKISYNIWKTKAEINYSDIKYSWRYTNFRNTKWEIFNSAGVQLTGVGSITKGWLQAQTDDGLLILTALYITNHFVQTSFAILLLLFILFFSH